MIGYRKFAIQIFAVVAGLVLAYFGKEAITEQFIQGGTGIIVGIFELLALLGIPQGGAVLYNRDNIKAKKVLQSNGGMALPMGLPMGLSAPTLEDDAMMIKAPLDIDKLLELADNKAKDFFGYQTANTEETGLYFAFRDLGNVTKTSSLDHALQYYDKLLELAQKSWYAETEKVLGKGKGFSWAERDRHLEDGDKVCPALTAYSWARRYSLDGLYNIIERDMVSSSWLEGLIKTYPHTDIVTKLQTNCTLFRVGALAQQLYIGQEPKTKGSS
jgi:hypothetical protein